MKIGLIYLVVILPCGHLDLAHCISAALIETRPQTRRVFKKHTTAQSGDEQTQRHRQVFIN